MLPWTHRHRPVGAAAVAVAVAVLVAAGCARSDDGEGPGDRAAVDVEVAIDSGSPAAIAAVADGGLVVGERLTGRIRRIDPSGELASEPIAAVDVAAAADDQRGLLGLAIADDVLYASWTRPEDGRLVVGELSDATVRVVWEGPVSTDQATGGHLDIADDGRLVIGIGDLLDPSRVDDPTAPNGKLLAIDPAGPPDQEPTVLSSGWNNPYAFVVTESGEIWVADNAPGRRPERIGRGDADGERSDLAGRRAPAALVELGPNRFGLCGFLDGELVPVDVGGRSPEVGEPLADGCRTGATVLTDGRVAVTDGSTVTLLDLPEGG